MVNIVGVAMHSFYMLVYFLNTTEKVSDISVYRIWYDDLNLYACFLVKSHVLVVLLCCGHLSVVDLHQVLC